MIKIEENIHGKNNSRVCTVNINSKKFLTPFYFPSITSAETRSDITSTINFITSNNYSSILVSCFDLFKLLKDNMPEIKKINRFFQNGGIILLDSGEFEKYHFGVEWTFEQFEEVVRNISSDFFTSFDKTSAGMEQNEIEAFSKINIPKSLKISKDNNCIVVCHGAKPSDVKDAVEKILKENKNLQCLAVPERECGSTLLEQCKIISDLRHAINEHNNQIILHILGSGNPISISALSYAGADTFDSVDWSRWGINPKTFEYDNIALVKLFNCTCVPCGKTQVLDEKFRAWEHNLELYNYYLTRLRNAISKNQSLKGFLENENIDQSVILNLSKLF